ncbi:MAG: trypsin-like peptidase domain-containing protein [Planctomycetes bacterium]|nr:trypsin-like peptidase domain-containing protein [Planctomycetota bacterium]
MRTITRHLAALALATATLSPLTAQIAPELSTTHLLDVDSGYVRNDSTSPAAHGIPACVWSKVVRVPGSAWLRLSYAGVLLAGAAEPGADGSFLKLTSLRDGQSQTQHLVHVDQWRETSAYLNGDAVLVELWAQPGTGDNRLIVGLVTAGPAVGEDTICGTVDNRVLSYDNRAARNQPGGCTSWMINDCNHCFLTAGHCSSSLQVIEFNVPLSTASGSLQHPPPQDQYAIDPASLQSNGGQGIGNDFAYFGVFPNSNTNLTPHQAYGGQVFDLQSTPPAVNGQSIRITGYGTTSSPVSPTYTQVQKTHAGPYVTFTGSTVQYQTDTTGGNSGSPVILDGTNQAIGIHTHGGCTSTGGQNSGTGSNHAGLQNAIANPLGICQCTTITFTYPNGRPTLVDPGGATTIRVAIGGALTMQPGSLRFHVSTGGAFQTLVPTQVGNNLFDVGVPASNCAGTVTFWFSAQDTSSTTYTDPENAPAALYAATSAHSVTGVRSYDFNTAPPGWSVTNTSLQAGPWQRGVPIDPQGPSSDFDGSGQCWVTGNSSGVDVDGGPTVLTTETFNLGATANPVVRYALWFATAVVDDDLLLVEASADGGTSWTTIESLSEFTGWELRGFRVLDHFSSLGQLVVRFSVADVGNNSTTEAAMDAFVIEDVSCAPATWTLFGAGCRGGNGTPTLIASTLPALGSNFRLISTNLSGGAAFMITGLSQQNVPLQPYGFGPGCTLLVSMDSAQYLQQIGSGVAIWNMSIPNNLGFAGMHLYNQVVEISGVSAVSPGGNGTIQ